MSVFTFSLCQTFTLRTSFSTSEMHFGKTLALACLAYTGTLAASSKEAPRIERRADKVQPLPPNNPQIYDWREEPWAHYAMTDSLDKLYPVNTKKVHIDHDDIITPSLPSDVKIPTLFLPTGDRKTKDLYRAAIAAFIAEEAKTPEQKEHELKQKWTDVQEFNEKTLCYYSTHAFNLRCSNKQDAKERRWKPNTFRKKYHKLKNKLIDEMRVEGLVNFGRELTVYLNETGMSIE
ncbi:hypothetical protein BKA64DRAFT_48826 [Cadophora sp. MPI-SDFR-AT-0126]|nr:hypothetical protein BKA64DRAFT_48826 [Leotiomycetes sp. MPI-SDFR-AT-0126]